MSKYIVPLIVLLVLVSSIEVLATPVLGEGAGSGNFYEDCNLDCTWTCNALGQRVKTCETAHGWCEVNGEIVPCDFKDIPVDERRECIVENRPAQETATYNLCMGNFLGNKAVPQTKYQTNINSECSNGKWITRRDPVRLSSGVCNTLADCEKKEWGLDKDGDGYYSLKWDKSLVNANNNIQTELCYPPNAIYNSADLSEADKISFQTQLTTKCGEKCFTDRNQWKPINTMKGKEPGCETYDTKCKYNDNDPRINLQTIYCKDIDTDNYGANCLRRSQITNMIGYKPLFELKGSDDCNDNDGILNPRTLWKKDGDGDGYWGRVIRSCEDKTGWTKIVELPESTYYDCDDENPDKTNLLDTTRTSSGVCGCEVEGTTLNGYVCVGNSDFIPQGVELTEFKKVISENKWIKTEPKNNGVQCSKEMCYNDVINKCVKEGTFWTDIGSSSKQEEANERGNLYCAKGEDGRGIWTTRTAKIRTMLLEAAEKENFEYTLYCDNYNFIAHTFEAQLGPPLNIKNRLNVLFYDDIAEIIGNGCILKTGSKIILGIPYSGNLNTTNGQVLNEGYQTLTDSSTGWKDGSSVHLYEPLKLAFIEKNGGTVITNLKGGSIMLNFISFLRNPLRTLNGNDVTKINNLMIKKFDRSYLNKNKNSYWFSVVENNKIYVKVTNQNFNVVNEIEKDCEGNCEKITTSIVGAVPFAGEKLWQDYSRTLRISGTNGGETFFQTQCNDNNLDTSDDALTVCSTPPGCFIPVCGVLGQCDFEVGGIVSGDVFDGCCMPGSTKTDDVDCAPETNYIPLETKIKTGQNCDARDLLVASISNEGLIAPDYTYDTRVCLSSTEKDLSGRTTSLSSCSTAETKVLGVENGLAFRDQRDGLCINPKRESSATLECFTDVSCSGATEIMSISKDSYALSGTPGTYERKVCCYLYDEDITRPPECSDHLDNDLNGLIDRDDPSCNKQGIYLPGNAERVNALNPTIGLNCPTGKIPIASLSGRTNAHISSGTDYEQKVCVDDRDIEVTLGQTCNTGYKSLIGISSLTNAHAYPQGEGEYQICTEVEGECSLKTTAECNAIEGEKVFSVSSTTINTPAYTEDTYLIEETIYAQDLTQLSFTNNGVTTQIFDDNLVLAMNFDNNVDLGEGGVNLALGKPGIRGGVVDGSLIGGGWNGGEIQNNIGATIDLEGRYKIKNFLYQCHGANGGSTTNIKFKDGNVIKKNNNYNCNNFKTTIEQLTTPIFATTVSLYSWSAGDYPTMSEFQINLPEVKDITKNSNDGLLIETDWVSEGKYGEALSLDGSYDFVQTNLTDLSGSELTVMYWFKGSNAQSAVRQQKVRKYLVFPWSRNAKHILSNDGGTRNGISADGNNGNTLNDGEWHHVAVTWKQNTVNGFTSYLDGQLIESRDSSDVPIPNINSPLQMGRHITNSEFTTGTIDEMKIWKKSLTANEIKFMYESNLKKVDATTWEVKINHTLTPAEKAGTLDYTINYNDQTTPKVITKNMGIQYRPPTEVGGNSHVGDLNAYDMNVCCTTVKNQQTTTLIETNLLPPRT